MVPAAASHAAAWGLPDGWPEDVTVIDITDPRGVPLSVNPFEPAPGCSAQAHADRLAALFEAAFRPPDPVRAAVRLALRRMYAACGWDPVTGAAQPGSAAPPGIPSIGDLTRAAAAAVADLGGDAEMLAVVRGFADVRLGSLWFGPAGRFLTGGHPADVPRLLRRKVIFTVGEVADDEAAAFLAGVLLMRVAELSRSRATKTKAQEAAPPGAVIVTWPASRFRPLLAEIRNYGTEVIRAEYSPAWRRTGAGNNGAAEHDRGETEDTGANGSGKLAFLRPESSRMALLGRRSAACGLQCRQRPCSGYELHEAGLLAGSDGQVWLRLWGHTLVLAFLTGRPLPAVPTAVRRTWPSLDARTRECLLATVVQGAVTSRELALRHSYDPRRLTAVAAATAAGLLAAASAPASAPASPGRLPAGRPGVTPLRAGQVWVIPQLRWLHEAERLCPLGQRHVRREDIAPPLDFDLAGLPDWPGIRVGARLDGLRRHRLSMESERNRLTAATALLGAERGADHGGGYGAAGFDADLATAGIGLGQQQRLSYAARMLGAGQHGQEPGWLEVVLSWPSRLPGLAGEPALPEAATG